MYSKLPLLDAAGTFVRWVEPGEVPALLAAGAERLGTWRKTRALRWASPLPESPHRRYVLRKAGAGMAHRRETATNLHLVWTIDRVPDSTREIFTAVINDCLADAA